MQENYKYNFWLSIKSFFSFPLWKHISCNRILHCSIFTSWCNVNHYFPRVKLRMTSPRAWRDFWGVEESKEAVELIKSSLPNPGRFVEIFVIVSSVLSVTLPILFNLLCCREEVTFSCESVPLLMLPLQLPKRRFFTMCGVPSSLDGEVGVPGIKTSVSSSPVQQ